MHRSVDVQKLGVILAPTKNKFEQKAVLNPGVYQDGNTVHIYYRAIDRKNQSTVGYAKLDGPTKVVERREEPMIEREKDYESAGVEDPRIVKIDDTFYMTYTAHDGKNALIAYATSSDLQSWKKQGVISPMLTYDEAAVAFRAGKLKDRYSMFESYYEEFAGRDVLLWEKDGFFFPKKFRGKYALVHRILPDIHLIYFKSFNELKKRTFWETYLRKLAKYVVLENRYWFESRNIGGGAPPIETKDGWLFIFHCVEELNKARVYHAGAALLDLKNPLKIVGRLDYPLFSPELDWEKHGLVSNVVFPTGTAIFEDTLYIYYGAADSHIAVASISITNLLKDLKAEHKKMLP